MKNIWIAALLLLLPVQLIFANTVVRSGETVTVAENQSVEGGFYVLAGTAALSGSVTGDVTVIGGNVTIDGPVSEDLAVLAGTVNIQAPIKEDVRIVAGQVTISENIEGDLVVVAGMLNILSSAKISGDVLFRGGEATIGGSIGGKLIGDANKLRVDSAIAGGIDMTASHLTLGDQANITGDVKYKSNIDLVRAPNAIVTGSVLKNATLDDDNAKTARETARSVAIVFLISMFATLSLYLVFKRLVESFSRQMQNGLVLKTVVGFIAIVMIPILAIILIVSVLGSVVGVIVLCLFTLLCVVTLPLMAVSVAGLLSKIMSIKGNVSIPYLILGAVIIHVLLFLPVVGAVIFAWLFLATMGGVILQLYSITR